MKFAIMFPWGFGSWNYTESSSRKKNKGCMRRKKNKQYMRRKRFSIMMVVYIKQKQKTLRDKL